MPIQATTAELRDAFRRARILNLRHWTFERAAGTPLVRWALERSAIAHRTTHHHPAQPRLI